jgi:CheY-like chemotaxis protein
MQVVFSPVMPHLLLVDDRDSVLITYHLVLAQAGYRITAAQSSVDACRHLEENHFDLILCDLRLDKHGDGSDVIKFARQHHPQIGAVLMTGYAGEDIEQIAQDAGAVLLTKPVRVPELLETIAANLPPDMPARQSA